MYYLKLGKKLGQNTAYSMVDGNGTETSSNDQDDRAVCRQVLHTADQKADLLSAALHG